MADLPQLLYVDDEPINIMIFEANFKRKFQVFTAKSGIEGLEKLNTNPGITIVISDMKMPEMNGLQFIAQAKDDFPDIQYFILSGYEITEEIMDALNNKLINKYFRKPFNMKEIERTLDEALSL